MRASPATSAWHGGAIGPSRPPPPSYQCYSPLHFRQPYDHNKFSWKPIHTRKKVVKVCRLGARGNANSDWDVKPYEGSRSVKKGYLEEQDVVTFLDPPNELIPLDPSSYNPASYLWKKIEDIPEERRHHLLSLLNPGLISRAWEVAGTRYDDPKLAKKSASSLLSDGDCADSLELWKCRTSGGNISQQGWKDLWTTYWYIDVSMTKLLALCGFPLSGVINSLSPLYFTVRECYEVMSTEQPCDLAYEFGDGVLNLPEYPQQFPKPEKHPWPFNDQVVIYVRHVGPGVLVGQAWQEGKELQQVPEKLCSEILMVKDYFAFSKNY
ncbi:hypothetical protein BUALT_Bualt07G0173900 [Buddleja alternifolia]|uniref:Uncharacterized protein n=1 Tax=Buddleja alternifolia TaxID=168488 RepID=A0AAV6XJR3_9LAMI|nr:hypothetical protein BUALT_Bualt07G0173900 [Buddleja alternifolia]